MERKFEESDIIKFIYDEMTASEHEQFVEALCTDEALWEKYETLLTTKEAIEHVEYEPSTYSCEKVMEYVHQTSSDGSRGPRKPTVPGMAFEWYGVLTFIMVLFTSLTITGSVYNMKQNSSPLVQQVPKKEVIEWDDDLDKQIESVEGRLTDMRNTDAFGFPIQ